MQRFFSGVLGPTLSFSNGSSSSSSIAQEEPNFVIPRQRPRLAFELSLVQPQRENYEDCMFGFLLDANLFPKFRLQTLMVEA